MITPLYRKHMRKTLPHFRVEVETHKALKRIAKQYDIKMAELCRLGVDQLVKADWPKVQE